MSARVAVGNRALDEAESVVPFSSATRAASGEAADPLDNAGRSILDLLQRAAGIAEENSQHAIDVAQKLAAQLRAAENRIRDIEAEARYHQERADRAEKWLYQISVEIEQRFFRADDNRRTGSAPTPQSILRTYGRRA
jgi:hypothetical protein